jgi:hypothetical protein
VNVIIALGATSHPSWLALWSATSSMHHAAEVSFVGFIEVLFTKLYIVSDERLVLCIHNQSLWVMMIDLAQLLPIPISFLS